MEGTGEFFVLDLPVPSNSTEQKEFSEERFKVISARLACYGAT
jgi:hypothetical protein